MTVRRIGQWSVATKDATRSAVPANPPKLARVAWMSVFETGNTELDAWHRKLVDACNRLLQLVTTSAEKALVVAAAEDFVGLCAEHFQVEEEILEQLAFPRRDEHAAEHRRIEDELLAVIWQLRDAETSTERCNALSLQLAPLLIDLMVRYDTDYRSHVLERQGR